MRQTVIRLVAVSVGILAFTNVGWANPPAKQKPSAKAHNQIERPGPPRKPIVDASYSAYPDKSSDICYSAKDHEAADLCAQWRAALAAEDTAKLTREGNLINVLIGAFTLLSLIAVWVALFQGRQAHKLAETTAKRQLRAYLYVSEVHIIPKKPGELWASIHNAGETPATHIWLKTEVLKVGEDRSVAIDFGPVGPKTTRPHKVGLSRPIHPDDNWTCMEFVRFTYRYRDVFGTTHQNDVTYFLDLSAKREKDRLPLYPCPTEKDEVDINS